MTERALPAWIRTRSGLRLPRAPHVGVSVDVGPAVIANRSGGSPPLMKPGGTGFIITPSDVERYIGLLDPLIKSLDDDIGANLVYADPGDLDTAAKEGGSIWWPGKDTSAPSDGSDLATDISAQAAALRARAAGRSAAQVAREIAFSKEWRAFFDKWPKDKTCGVSDGCYFKSDMWNKIEADDVAFQGFHNNYAAMGYTPTLALPPSPPASPGFNWTALLWIAGIGVTGYALSQVWHLLPARRIA